MDGRRDKTPPLEERRRRDRDATNIQSTAYTASRRSLRHRRKCQVEGILLL